MRPGEPSSDWKELEPQGLILLCELSRELCSTLDSHRALALALSYLPTAMPCHVGGFFLEDMADLEHPLKSTITVYAPDNQSLATSLAQKVMDCLKAINGDSGVLDKLSIVIEKEKQPDGSPPQGTAELGSFAALPMIMAKRVTGMLGVGSVEKDAFDNKATALLSAIAELMAPVLNNCRSFEQMSLEKQRLETAINYMSDGLIMTDQNGVVTLFNPALERLTGLSAAQVVGKNVKDLPNLTTIIKEQPPEELPPAFEKVPRVLKVQPSAVTEDFSSYRGEIRVVHDVTQEKELARMKSEFVTNISHELRTPLHSIRGFNKLLMENKVPDADTRKEFLAIIDEQSGHLSKLIESLIDVSAIEAGRFRVQKQRLSIPEVIRSAVTGLHGLASERGIAISVDIQATLPDVYGDGERLRQVVTNLVGNAIKFSHDGGNIAVTGDANDTEALIQITDHGTGIPPEAMPHLFERFYRAKDTMARGGTGLGLYITKQIIEVHGGRIWVESRECQGSTFSFTVPLYSLKGGHPGG